MIRHIVLFRLKDARPDKVEAAAQMLRSMRGKIEGLLDLEVGLDFLASERSYHLALLCTFDNEEHFAAYADHPVHRPRRAGDERLLRLPHLIPLYPENGGMAMGNEITLSYIQEMVRRREGRLGEKQQLLHLMRAMGDLAQSVEREEGMEGAIGDMLYNLFALANTYGIDIEDCLPESVPVPQQEKRTARGLDFRPL